MPTFQDQLNDALLKELKQLKARFDALERHVLFGEPYGEGDSEEDRLMTIACEVAMRGDRRLMDLHCARFAKRKETQTTPVRSAESSL
jgi:hypothetical protein